MCHERWWDYSIAPLNIQGRVSVPSSFGFGVGAVRIVYVVNAHIVPIVMDMDIKLARILSIPLALIFVADVILSAYYAKKHTTPLTYDKVNASVGYAVDRINPKGYSLGGYLKNNTNFFK